MASTPSTKARHTAGVLSTNSIPDSTPKSNNPDENSSKRRALPDTTEAVGKTKKDNVDARVQMARSARSVNFPKRYRKFI